MSKEISFLHIVFLKVNGRSFSLGWYVTGLTCRDERNIRLHQLRCVHEVSEELFYPRKQPGNVLILDSHSSHGSDMAVLELAAENDLIIFCLPSRITQYL
ncbi:hypothetical protein TNIN_310971 [Trichonephila inaurata madagascariensis]|uniref:Uncharacterized protein n=1 Tax=Trichonephila inaurata madagascariensis TaxID=2747483 RepID=A0A8X7C9B7_9ARAC|nr:hypothetical protein TNIN_310971 [Trichonephila inaurata madagascariensis]